MKLRKITILLALSLLLTMLPSVPFGADAKALDTEAPLYAGYAKLRIDPSEHPEGEITGLPMLGYGTSTDRLSTGGMDDTGDGVLDEKDGLFATCIAITDQYGKTILYYGIDIINVSVTWGNPVKYAILAALTENGYRVDFNDLYMSASHTHNAPDLNYGISFGEEKLAADPIAQQVKKYREWLTERLIQLSLTAMSDREEVILTKGEMDVSDAIKAMNPNATANQQRMNAVRHYKTVVNGQTKYGGSNFGYTSYKASTVEAMESVDRMHLVQLTPKSGKKDPIVMVNWDAHVTMNSTTATAYGRNNHTKISSDWVNNLRYGIEAEGYRVAFSQSTGGNKTGSIAVTALKNPDILENGEQRAYKYGTRLAEITLYGLKNYMGEPLDTSRIRNITARFDFKTNAPTPEEAALLTAMYAADPSTYPEGYTDLVDYLCHADTWPNRTKYYDTYPFLKNINSRYQLSNARSRMQYLDDPDGYMLVGVLSIGKELSFVVAGNELADRYSATATLEDTTDNDWDDLIDDTYGRPIVMGYTNGANGYIPHQIAFTYNEGSTEYAIGSYESQSTHCARYTGEKLVAFYDDLLDTVNADQVRYQCACGGKAANGVYGHTCEVLEFLPWSRSDCLPLQGNYYLTEDVVTTCQWSMSQKELRLDLNGHDVTYQIPAAEGAKAEAGESHSTRAIVLSTGSQLFLTDSTDNPGTISRDLSLLTEAQRNAITNYGLLVMIYDTSRFTMFGGVLDATGTIAGGGGCVCVYNENSAFTMYGGLLKGAKSYNGGVVFNRGSTWLYGGELTGGTTSGNSGYPGVYSLAESGKSMGRVTVGGDVRIWDNKRKNGAQINVYSSKPQESLIVSGNLTGKVGVAVSGSGEGKVVGRAEDATVAPGSLVLDNYTSYRIAIQGEQLVMCAKIVGDIDGNQRVNIDDVIRLLLHVSMPDEFPVDANGDIDNSGSADIQDVIRLLLHVSMPDEFPL